MNWCVFSTKKSLVQNIIIQHYSMLEFAGIIILGISAQWLAWRTKVPAILPLILIGLLVGPLSTLWTADGQKLLEPIYNPATGKGLFPGQYLFYFVSLSIGVILFEGGLTLKQKEIKGVAPAIGKLITLGSLVTFIGGGLAAHWIMGLSWSISFLFSALIIVTGPTVIAPILQNVPLTRNVATVLKWEGILIDPIGALVAVLVFEFIASGQGHIGFTSHVLKGFFQIILIGTSLGAFAAYALYQFIKREWIPHYLLNVFTLAVVLGVFVLSDELAHESGLLAVVIMGMVMANLNVPRIKEILSFKESLSVLLIAVLFILLAAHIEMKDLLLLLDWRCLCLFGIVILALRPLGVFWSSFDSDLQFREKIFISWVGPRGIVAAGIASLFGIKLTADGVPGANYITPLVFMIVMGTVLLNATTARIFAKLLGVIQKASNGILIIGANNAARAIGKYLHDNNRHVVVLDANERSVEKARNLGLEAIQGNIYTDDLEDHFELLDIGYLISMTSNAEVNEYAIHKFKNIFGENGVFRLLSQEEMVKDKSELPDQGIFSYTDDYLNLNEAIRDYPEWHQVDLKSKSQLKKFLDKLKEYPKSIPIFLKHSDGFIDVIPYNLEKLKVEEGAQLIYLGQEVDQKV